MGLDMYLTGRLFHWSCYPNHGDERRETGHRVKHIDVELGYWRKHPNLHGYIVQQFAKGVDDCQEIELSAENLRAIIAAVKLKNLPQTSGFFFGESDGSMREIANDVAILEGALDWLAEGDREPFDTDLHEGPGFTATIVKPQTETRDKPQRVSRSVHYEASW